MGEIRNTGRFTRVDLIDMLDDAHGYISPTMCLHDSISELRRYTRGFFCACGYCHFPGDPARCLCGPCKTRREETP